MHVVLSKDEQIKLLNCEEVFVIAQNILLREQHIDRNREHLWIMGLEQNNRLLYIELVSMGSMKETIVEPMEIFSFALQKRVAKIIMIHNHPTGDLEPSEADKDVTDRMIQAGLLLDTPILDHIIISETSYFSFERSGLLAMLAKSLKYVPQYKLKGMIASRAGELANTMVEKVVEKALKKQDKEKTKEMARAMKVNGISPEVITHVTGMTTAQIRAL